MKKLLIILIIFLIPTIAFADTWYVTQDGAGGSCVAGGECSVAEFNALTGSSYQGDTFYFSGTFTTSIDVNISGTIGNYITLDGYEADNTTYMNLSEVSGRALVDHSGGCMNLDEQSYIIVQEFEFTDCTGIVAGEIGTHHMIFRRLYGHEMPGGFLNLHSGSYSMTIGGALGHGNVSKNIGTTTADEHYGINQSHDHIYSYNYLYQDSNDYRIDGFLITGNAVSAQSHDLLFEYNRVVGYVGGGYTEDGLDTKNDAYNVIIRFNDFNTFDDQGAINIQWAHDYYIYGNRVHTADWFGIAGAVDDADNSYDDMYIFANIIWNCDGWGIYATGNDSNHYIFNNTIAESGLDSPGSAEGNVRIRHTPAIAKFMNNIVYKGRPNESDYQQIYVDTSADQIVDTNNNQYYWPGQTSKIFWGDAGLLTLAQVKAGSTHGLPEEQNSAEGDPGLEDIANNDYRIAGSGSAVVGAGVDMGSGNIATVTIEGGDGVSNNYTVPWDFALGPNTVWGSGSTLPVIDKQGRDDHQWDIGAYVFTTDTSPPIVTVVTTDGIATESGTTTGTWTLYCSPACATAPGTAITYVLSGTASAETTATGCGAGDDYTLTSLTTVNIIEDTPTVITITACDDADVEDYEETAIITLSEEATYDVGTPSTDTILIQSEDAGQPIYDYGVNKVRGAKLR